MEMPLKTSLTAVAFAAILWPGPVATDPVHLAGHLRQDSLAEQIDQLTVAEEQRDGYDRDRFGDYDRQALLSDSLSEHGCYHSRADDICHSDPADVDVDHIVALAEAWDSGAGTWTPERRDRFAADEINLWLMTDDLNRAKSDLDIAQWQPPDATVVCDYLRRWVQVKLSYDLSVDPTEQDAISQQAEGCQPIAGPATTPSPTARGSTTPVAADGAATGTTPPAVDLSQQADQPGLSPALVATLTCLSLIVVLAVTVLVAQQRRRSRPGR